MSADPVDSIEARRPQREEFAAGDVLVRFPLADTPRLVILSPIAKPGWHARAEGTATRVLFPGSAVLFEGAYYEVRRIAHGDGTEPHRYELSAWEDRFTLREVFEYTRAECIRVETAVRAALRKQAAAHTLAWMLPLVGLLPARLQRAIDAEYGLPAARATFLSALILLGLSTGATLVGMQALFSQAMAGPRPGPFSLAMARYLALSLYLVLESIVRYRLAFSTEVAMGSAPVALPVLVLLWLRDALRGRPAGELPSPRAEPTIRGLVPAGARDTVNALGDGRLEVLSLLPKPHWGPRSAVHYRDSWWALADRQELAGRDPQDVAAPAWRFILDPWPEHLLVQDPQEYAPSEVVALAFEAARERRRATVETLGALLGLLPVALQQRLAEVYGYDPRSRTGWSLVLVAACGGFAVTVATARLLQGVGSWLDSAVGVAAAALLLETAARSAAWFRGEVSGSVLGGLVRPLAEHVLRLGPER